MSESEERAARLRARIDESEDQEEYAESWRPDAPGDEIAGEIVRYATGHTSYGESRIAVLRTSEGDRSVWLFHAVLRRAFEDAKPRPGEYVLIRYEGRRESASGNEYANYNLAVDREEEPSGAEPGGTGDGVPY